MLTRIPDSWAWVRTDVVIRLIPFTAAYALAYGVSGGAGWLGLRLGDLRVQLVFALVGVPLMFVAATAVQLWLTRRRGDEHERDADQGEHELDPEVTEIGRASCRERV